MFEFVESVLIDAPPAEIWDFIIDVEQWWLASNPEHMRLEVRRPDSPITLGTEIAFEECVAGIKGQADGTITAWVPGSHLEWEGRAIYRYWGFRLQVHEGVSWRIENNDSGSKLSARVWAKFSSSIVGRMIEWYVRAVLKVVDRDRDHTRRELEYLKSAIESAQQSPEDTC